ncbi:unnamed protein product, partial [marine sediment metagenome]
STYYLEEKMMADLPDNKWRRSCPEAGVPQTPSTVLSEDEKNLNF